MLPVAITLLKTAGAAPVARQRIIAYCGNPDLGETSITLALADNFPNMYGDSGSIQCIGSTGNGTDTTACTYDTTTFSRGQFDAVDSPGGNGFPNVPWPIIQGPAFAFAYGALERTIISRAAIGDAPYRMTMMLAAAMALPAPWNGTPPTLDIGANDGRTYDFQDAAMGTYSLAGTGLADGDITMSLSVSVDGVETENPGLTFGGGTWECTTLAGTKILRIKVGVRTVAICIGYP